MGDTLVDMENMDPLWGGRVCMGMYLCARGCAWVHRCAQVCHGLNIILRGMCMSMCKRVCLCVL